MFELLGAKNLQSNFFSLLLRILYIVIMTAGWALFAFTNFAVSDGTDPFVWVVAVSVCVGFPAMFISGRIEQYWLYSIWGLGIGRAFGGFLVKNPDIAERWKSYAVNPINAEDPNSEVAKALAKPTESEKTEEK